MSNNWIKFDFDNSTIEVNENGNMKTKKVTDLKKYKEEIYGVAKSYKKVDSDEISSQSYIREKEITEYEDLSPEQKKEHKRLMGWSQEILMLDKLYKKNMLTNQEMAKLRQEIYDAYGMGRYTPCRQEKGKGLKIFNE